jgi:hypothetical protein
MTPIDNRAPPARPQRPLLTDALVRNLARLPRRVVYDRDMRGFGIRLSPTARSWILNYVTAEGRERRTVIGDFASWPAKKARTRATELRRHVDEGRDPLAEKTAQRTAPTVAELLIEYARGHGATTRR